MTRTAIVPSTYVNADTGAIVANITAVRPTKSAYLTVWPNDGAARPLVSNVNVAPGDIAANMMITGLGGDWDFKVNNLFRGADERPRRPRRRLRLLRGRPARRGRRRDQGGGHAHGGRQVADRPRHRMPHRASPLGAASDR